MPNHLISLHLKTRTFLNFYLILLNFLIVGYINFLAEIHIWGRWWLNSLLEFILIINNFFLCSCLDLLPVINFIVIFLSNNFGIEFAISVVILYDKCEMLTPSIRFHISPHSLPTAGVMKFECQQTVSSLCTFIDRFDDIKILLCHHWDTLRFLRASAYFSPWLSAQIDFVYHLISSFQISEMIFVPCIKYQRAWNAINLRFVRQFII